MGRLSYLARHSMGRAACWTLLGSALLFSAPCASRAQSTSSWIPVRSRADDGIISAVSSDPGNLDRLARNASYLTISTVAARICRRQDWWRKLVERDRQATVGIDVQGTTLDNQPLTDKRISDPFDLRHIPGDDNLSHIDIAWSVHAVEDLPTTFKNLTVAVHIDKTAHNGLSELLSAAADLSKSTPALTMSAAAAGGVSAATALSNFLFDNGLVQTELRSTQTIDLSGKGMPCGFYVVFAGDSVEQYRCYINDPAKLDWDGAQLRCGNCPVRDVTYLVIRIRAERYLFGSDPTTALNSGTQWAALYQQARSRALEFPAGQTVDKVRIEIQSLEAQAQAILARDTTLTDEERVRIQTSLESLIDGAALKHYATLAQYAASQPPAPGSSSTASTTVSRAEGSTAGGSHPASPAEGR